MPEDLKSLKKLYNLENSPKKNVTKKDIENWFERIIDTRLSELYNY